MLGENQPGKYSEQELERAYAYHKIPKIDKRLKLNEHFHIQPVQHCSDHWQITTLHTITLNP